MKYAENTLHNKSETVTIFEKEKMTAPCCCKANNKSLKKALTFSVIVPIMPEKTEPLVLRYLEKLIDTEYNIEVILTKGHQPSKQRNTAAAAAKGDILVFLDDDSCPDKDFFKRLDCHFKDSNIAGVGGPNLALPTDEFIPNLVNAVLTSRIGILSKRSRYESFGKIRKASDSDLILCNFAIRKKTFVESGGFYEKLYPNEENEFFERFANISSGGIILYDPMLIVRRPRSESISSFLKKIFGYGKGRSHQFKCRKSLWSLIHIFGCMVFVLPVILLLSIGIKSLAWLAGIYGVILLFRTFSCLVVHKQFGIALMIAPVTAATHITYVIGLWKGILSSRPEIHKTDIELECLNLSKCIKHGVDNFNL